MRASSPWTIRPVERGDLDVLIALARSLGPGMTTFPPDPDAIAVKIEASIETFAGRRRAADGQYVMALTGGEDRAVLGVCAVYPSVGWPYGFFSYKVGRLVHRSRSLDRSAEIELLTLANDYTGATEVGSLAVHPLLRGSGAARFLARSRYMLIAAFPDLFADRVMAEMRGWQDEDGASPFWTAVGEKFFHMPFEDADRLSAVDGAEFIAELMPKNPIYSALLPQTARAVIGRPHDSSAKAMAMLLEEGFRYENHVDVFDAGPQVHVERDRIRTVVESRVVDVGDVDGGGVGERVIACSGGLDHFRVTLGEINTRAGVAEVSEPMRRALDLAPCAAVRISPYHPGRRTV